MSNNCLIISGANSNIGSELAKYYHNMCRPIILLYHENSHRIEHLLQYDRVYHLAVDIRDSQKLTTGLNDLISKYNLNIGGLVHTSSLRSIDFKPLAETDQHQTNMIIEVNILGTINLLQTVIPHLRANGGGRIVLFGSNVSRKGLMNGAVYAMTKAATANLSRSVALEEGKNNIQINTISPGPVLIDDSAFSQDYRDFRNTYYEQEKKTIPMQRLAEIQDIINACDFLLSEKNTYISGEEIFLTGGKV